MFERKRNYIILSTESAYDSVDKIVQGNTSNIVKKPYSVINA